MNNFDPKTPEQPQQLEGRSRKPFVEPTVSVPKDVLDATNYFLLSSPGVSLTGIT